MDIHVKFDIDTKSSNPSGDYGWLLDSALKPINPYETDIGEGTTIQLRAAFKPDYINSASFLGWEVDDVYTDSEGVTNIYTSRFASDLNASYTVQSRSYYEALNYKITITAKFAYNQSATKSVTVISNSENAGIVNGGGNYRVGPSSVANLSAYAKPGYEFYRWHITYKTLNSAEEQENIDYYDYTQNYIFSVSDNNMSNIVITCEFRRISSDSGDWNVISYVELGSTDNYITVSLSKNVYRTYCRCRWGLRVLGKNNTYVYFGGGKGDWLDELWNVSYKLVTPDMGESYTLVSLPLSDNFTQLVNLYSDGVNALAIDLLLEVFIDNYNGNVIDIYSISNNNYRPVTISVANTYGMTFDRVTLTYPPAYLFKPTTGIELAVAGWSKFNGDYKVSSTTPSGSGNNYIPIVSAKLTYSNPITEEYEDGSNFDVETGIGTIGSSDPQTFVTLANNVNTVDKQTVTVTVTNSIGSELQETTEDGMKIYGWQEPSYTMLNMYRCDSTGTIRDNIELNTCIYLSFRVYCSVIDVGDNINRNAIPLIPDGEKYYVSEDYITVKVMDNADYDKVWADGNNTYHVIIGKDSHLDVNSTYTLKVSYRDNVTKYFNSSDPNGYYVKYQRSNSSIPLSLMQDDMNRIAVGIGVTAVDPYTVTLGTDGVLESDITLSASKSVLNEEGTATTIVTTSAPAYDLIARGGQNSVSVSETDIALGKYINNIRLISKAEFNQLDKKDKDPHTMYILYY